MMTAPSCPGSSRPAGGGGVLGQRGGQQLPKSIFSLLKTLAKIRQLEAPSSIPVRQDKQPYKKLGMFEGPKPSSVKEIRPRLTKTNVSAI